MGADLVWENGAPETYTASLSGSAQVEEADAPWGDAHICWYTLYPKASLRCVVFKIEGVTHI